MTLRPAREGDEPFVRGLWTRCLQEEYTHLRAAEQEAEWRMRYGHHPRHLWIAETEDGSGSLRPVGFIWLLSLPDPTFGDGDWWLYYVAVEPSARGQGVARQLLDHARARLPGTIRLLVRCDSPVRSLYTRVGASPFREEWHWPAPRPQE